MVFKIIHEARGRIRVRCGQNYFSKKQGISLENVLNDCEFILNAETSYVNGGILIYYEKDYRDKVLSFLKSLKIKELPEAEINSSNSDKEAKDKFQKRITNLILKRIAYKFFVPAPISKVLTVLRSLSYMKTGIKNLANLKVNVEVLDATSITAALAKRDFGTANSIMFLLSLSEVIEEYTMDRAKSDLAKNLSLNVDKVWLVDNENNEVSIPLEKLKASDKIKVRSGSVIPVDGTIVGGEAFINESSMTGESTPVQKNAGKTVYAGTVIEEGSIIIETTALNSDTRLSKIINLINDSENYKADVHSKALRLADKIVPFSFLTAIGTYAITRNITKALSVLMVDYSCAIKLSTPICIASAMSEAAKNGIVVKGGKFLEAFANADTIVFDKTGTLTMAEPSVQKVYAVNGFEEDYVLRTSACLEEHFPHSVARAIVRKAEQKNLIHAEEHAEVEYVVAHGISSHIGSEKVIIGSSHFVFEDEKISISDEEKAFIEENSKGYSTIFLAVGSKLAGFICIDDPIRTEAIETIAELKKNNFDVLMLTGDSEYAAKKVSSQLGIDNFKFGILPEDKSEVVELLKSKGKKVVMVGDGINDTPALAAANVSVSMKDSSDIAREVADMIILSEDLSKLIIVRKISENMLRKIHRNYKFIVGFNTSLLFLGIAGLIQPSTSAFLHNFSTMALSTLSMRNCLDKK